MRSLKKSVTTLASLSLATTGIAAAAVASAPSAHAQDCSNVYFMVDGHLNGTTGNTWKGTHVPAGAQMRNFYYDDGIFPVAEPHDLDTTQKVADPALEQQVVAFHQECPNAHITLTGYSFGALIAGNVAASLATKATVPHNQLNAILIADPRRAVTPDSAQGASGGIMSMLPDLPGMHMTGPRDFKDVSVSEICAGDDPICNLANPISNAQGAIGEGQRFPGSHTLPYDAGHAGSWADPAKYTGIPLTKLPASAPISWGRPLFDAPTPNSLLNGNPVYEGVIAGLSQAADTLDWANVLNSFGLPGDSIVHQLIVWAEASGIQI